MICDSMTNGGHGYGKGLVFSGVQPSASQVHLGNYLGAMRRFVELAETHNTIFCIVDLHALTSVSDRKALEFNTLSLAAAYVAIGLDPARTTLFRQSDVPEVTELTWYLACQFPLGLLERAHSIKDARAKGLTPNSGLMFYPILMAADILLYKATHVPVGPDQKQHLEMAREVAQKFNGLWGDVFPLPEPLIADEIGVVPGLDGRKMSKSYDNFIGLFEDAKTVKQKISRIVTDSKGVADPKDPDTCNVFQLYRHFSTQSEQEALAERYRAGGMGYGEAKMALFENVERTIAPMRERYQSLMSDPQALLKMLGDGARRASAIAQKTIGEVRQLQGLGGYLR